MKTYTTTTEKPRLVINYDDAIFSPRQDNNLGYFITCEDRYNSPDNNEELKEIIKDTQHYVKDVDGHMEAIKARYEDQTLDKVLAIYPVYRYEHGNVMYKRGTAGGFDVSNCGFYVITDQTLAGMLEDRKEWERIIDNELDIYTKYVNGEVYRFTLYDVDGEEIDSCTGFYDIDDIKEHLPEEWKNEDLTDYLKN